MSKISDISISISSGLTPLKSNDEYWNSNDIPWLKTEQLGQYKIYDTNEFISKKAFNDTSLKLYPVNTISVAMYGEGKTRGNVSILMNEMTTNQACCNIIVDKEKANHLYVYYWLKNSYLKLRALAAGVRKNLNSEDIKNFEIDIKDRETQDNIASVLSVIDDKISNNNRINAELESMAKTIYDYWFTQFDFPDENGKPYKSSGGKMVWNEELKREIPEGWGVGFISNLGEIVAGGTPSTSKPEYFTNNGIAWITPYDLANTRNKYISHGERDITSEGLKNSSAILMPEGSVLLTSRAPIGYLAIAKNKLSTNQGFKSIVPNKGYNSEYIYQTIHALIPHLKTLGTGSTFTEISKTVFSSTKIILPPITTVEEYTDIVSVIEHKRVNCEEENQQLASLRDWLLPMLMNGQVGFEGVE